MKNKHNLLFAMLYFISIFVGYVAVFFNPLFKNIYYGHITYVFESLIKIIIYILEIVLLDTIYKKIYKEEIKKEKKELPIKKTITLYFITIFFITLISILSGWQLKPLSDLGDKYTILKIYDKLCDVAILSFEIYIMMKIFVHFDKFYSSNFKSFKYFTFSIFLVLLTYGIYRLILDFSIYQFVFIPFIVLLGFIYPYTEKSFWKTYLIALLVFLF